VSPIIWYSHLVYLHLETGTGPGLSPNRYWAACDDDPPSLATDRLPKLLPRAGVAREGAVEAKTAIASTTPRAEIYAAADGVYQVGKYTKWI
jgi:hypothetical protein